MFHSVGCNFGITPMVPWEEDEKRECLFVIIGKNLQQKWLEEEFKKASVKN